MCCEMFAVRVVVMVMAMRWPRRRCERGVVVVRAVVAIPLAWPLLSLLKTWPDHQLNGAELEVSLHVTKGGLEP